MPNPPPDHEAKPGDLADHIADRTLDHESRILALEETVDNLPTVVASGLVMTRELDAQHHRILAVEKRQDTLEAEAVELRQDHVSQIEELYQRLQRLETWAHLRTDADPPPAGQRLPLETVIQRLADRLDRNRLQLLTLQWETTTRQDTLDHLDCRVATLEADDDDARREAGRLAVAILKLVKLVE